MADIATEIGVKTAMRLTQEGIIWLVTVRGDGAPQSSPVWFLWEDETILIYSQPNTPKLRNIERNPKVSLHLNSDQWGNEVAILSGNARIEAGAPIAREVPTFVKKYVDDLHSAKSLADFDRIMNGYDAAIRVTPTRLREW